MRKIIIAGIIILGLFLIVLNWIPRGIEPLTEVYIDDYTKLPSNILLDKDYNFSFTVHNLEYQDMKYDYTIGKYDANGEILGELENGSVILSNNQNKTVYEKYKFDAPFEKAQIKVVVRKDNLSITPEFKKKFWWPDPNYSSEIEIHFWVLPYYTINSTTNGVGLNSSLIYRVNDNLLYSIKNSKIVKSLDGGKTWFNLTSSSLSGSVGDNGFFKDSRGTLFHKPMGTGNITMSLGNDTNWTQVKVFACQNKSGEGIGEGSMWGMTEAKDGSLLLGEYGANIITSKGNCSYIHRSTDGGQTWKIVYNSTAAGYPGRHIHLVKTDPFTGYIYATQGDGDGVSRTLRSTDNGTTWKSIENNSDTSQYLGLVFTSKYRIFATDKGNFDGIYRTSDDAHFENIFTFPANTNGYFWQMEQDPKTGFIVAGTVGAGTRNIATLVISTDGGSSWYPVLQTKVGTQYQGINRITGFDSNGYAFYNNNNLSQTFKFNFVVDSEKNNDS
jgi:hypothetical protein